MDVNINWKCLYVEIPKKDERILIKTRTSKKNVVFVGHLERICIHPIVGDKIYVNATIEEVRRFTFNECEPVELEVYCFIGYDFNFSSLTKSAYYELNIPVNKIELYYWDYFYETWLMPDIKDYQSIKAMFYD